MKLNKSLALLGICAGLATATAIGACGTAQTSASNENVNTGTVSFALSTVGPDGATYLMPSGAQLVLVSGGNYNYAPFSGTAPSQSFSLPAGTYTATMSGGTGDAGTLFTLPRSGTDGGATTASATLMDAQPYSFTITAGQTTNLTFHFDLANVGAVTFSNGSLNTTMSLDAGTAPIGHVVMSGTLQVQPSLALGGPTALNTLLSYSGTAAVPYSITMAVTGALFSRIDSACIPVSVTAVTASVSADAGSQSAAAAFVDEMMGTTGTFCAMDATSARYAGGIEFLIARNGNALTPQFAAALPSPDAGVSGFNLYLYSGTPSPTLYDGSTLQLGQSTTLTNALGSLNVSPPGQGLSALGIGSTSTYLFQYLP